jgi:hypothetical protein
MLIKVLSWHQLATQYAFWMHDSFSKFTLLRTIWLHRVFLTLIRVATCVLLIINIKNTLIYSILYSHITQPLALDQKLWLFSIICSQMNSRVSLRSREISLEHKHYPISIISSESINQIQCENQSITLYVINNRHWLMNKSLINLKQNEFFSTTISCNLVMDRNYFQPTLTRT